MSVTPMSSTPVEPANGVLHGLDVGLVAGLHREVAHRVVLTHAVRRDVTQQRAVLGDGRGDGRELTGPVGDAKAEHHVVAVLPHARVLAPRGGALQARADTASAGLFGAADSRRRRSPQNAVWHARCDVLRA
jgi:hypothetical protein